MIKLNLVIFCFFCSALVFAQFPEEKVLTNIEGYTFVPHPPAQVVSDHKISAMFFCAVKAETFGIFCRDTTSEPVPSDENTGWKLLFDTKGRVTWAELYLPGPAKYKYTYDEKGNPVSAEHYRMGNTEWQSKEYRKYDHNHYLLQRKIVWKEFYSGKTDQVSFFNYTWKKNYRQADISYNVTFDRGAPTKGMVTDKWSFRYDSLGYDTSMTWKEYKAETGKWKSVHEHLLWKRDTSGRIISCQRESGSDHRLEEWEYDAKGRLVSYRSSGFYNGSNQSVTRTFYYLNNGLLRGVHVKNSIMDVYLVVKYDRYG